MVSVVQTVETLHEDMVHDAQMDYYGTKLATCSSDHTIKVFDVRNKQQIQIGDLKGHDGAVWQLSWSHPSHGSLLASCGYDKKVIIWKEVAPNQWHKVYEYTDHESSVNTVSWAPHEYGLLLACGSSDGHISFLTGHPQGTWETCKVGGHTVGVNSVSWAPAVACVSSNSQTAFIKRLVSGGCDNLVKIWKFNNEEGWLEEARLSGHTDWVRDVAWAPCLTSSRQVIASASQDCSVILWIHEDAISAGQQGQTGGSSSLQGMNATSWKPVTLQTFADVVWHVSWSITGNILAVSGGDNKVTLYKENLDGQWICLTDVAQNQDNMDDDAN